MAQIEDYEKKPESSLDSLAENPKPEDNKEESNLDPKYQGKSAEEIADMHRAAEKLLGQQGSEIGELRKTVDTFILSQSTPNEPEEKPDFFTEPDKAVDAAINQNPAIKKADDTAKKMDIILARQELNERHPNHRQIIGDPKFVDWVKGSTYRQGLFQRGHKEFQVDALDELFTGWKEFQSTSNRQERSEQVKKASTGNVSGSGAKTDKKLKRVDIINLYKTDPKRYREMSGEIRKAYEEGRVV